MQSSNIVKIGILGCGPRGNQMGKIVSLLTRSVRLTAMSDPSREQLAVAKSLFPDVQFYESSEELIDKSGVDAVIVETPPEYHAHYVLYALDRNLHVMSEIPVVNTLEEADQIWKAANSARSLFMTGATANYRQKTRFLKELHAKGQLGKIGYMESEYMHCLINSGDLWRKNYETCLYCCHSLGPLLEVLDGDEFDTVSCMGTGDHFDCGMRDNVMAALLRTKSNVVCRFMCGFGVYHCGPAHRTVLYTDQGHFKFYNERAQLYWKNMSKYCQRAEFSTVEFGQIPERFTNDVEFLYDKVVACGGGHGGSDFLMIEDFADAIVNGKPSPVSVQKGLAMTIPGLYAALSAREGGAIKKIVYPWSSF